MTDGESEREMYHCIKCGHKHRRDSDIGQWHAVMERPELAEGGMFKKSTPDDGAFCAGVALGLALRDMDRSEVKLETYSEKYRQEGFDKYQNARDALYKLRDEYNTVVIRRHTGHEWATFRVKGLNHEKLKNVALAYDTRGMKWGVRT